MKVVCARELRLDGREAERLSSKLRCGLSESECNSAAMTAGVTAFVAAARGASVCPSLGTGDDSALPAGASSAAAASSSCDSPATIALAASCKSATSMSVFRRNPISIDFVRERFDQHTLALNYSAA